MMTGIRMALGKPFEGRFGDGELGGEFGIEAIHEVFPLLPLVLHLRDGWEECNHASLHD